MNELYNFHVDYDQANGLYMKLRKSKDKGFDNHDFENLQLKMIQSNTIPRLIPMSFEEINGESTIFYRLEGLRQLRPISKEKPLTMQEYYALFINIVQALQDSSNYMLSDQQYVLNEDFIYIGNGYHQVYLTYLPMNKIKNKSSIYEELKKLILNMASEVQGLKGVQFKMILSYIKDPGFSLQGLKQLLSQLQNTQQQTMQEETENTVPEQDEQTTIIKKVKKLPPLPRKMKTYSLLFGALALAIVWKLYDSSPNSIMLGVSSVLSVLVIVAVYVYWKVWRPGVEPIITEKEAAIKKKQSRSKQTVKSETKMEKLQQIDKDSEPTEEQVFHQHNQEIINQALAQQSESASALHMNSSPIAISAEANISSNQRDQTMLLDEEEMTGGKLPVVKNYIIVEREDEDERVELQKDNYIIGRADKGTDYVEKTIGVSRLHVEFIKLADTYGIKDLGSKNGTFINDEKIIPYKIHELKNEDKIQIGKIIYMYRVSQ
ncbi:DUF6382 domain-containing protein [Virgibacillus oceani]|uniref:FHA domain-containing protein n=1 Tax=Virgibacillus oceani TaxID=1479511 RepID=A0A917LWW0_9BACI|nr:DUF6382 domain-containing protein [Virgibacillus oceani]GGG63027.1 hypothetical protein GCM10011398_03010 [Virgibacillus oceani]